jgi:hypothetical protein
MIYWLLVEQSAWWASIISLAMMWAMGDRRWWAPWLGLLGQFFWGALAVYTQQWGLLIAVGAYTFVHARNAWKWRVWRDAEARL